MGKNVLSFKERTALLEKLRLVCKMVDGHAVYSEGMSDAKMAEIAGVTENNVIGLRREMIGELRPKGRGFDIKGQISGLQADLNVAYARIEALEERLDDLLAQLGVTPLKGNNVTNVDRYPG